MTEAKGFERGELLEALKDRLEAPTGQPPHKWTEGEKKALRHAMYGLTIDEAIHEMQGCIDRIDEDAAKNKEMAPLLGTFVELFKATLPLLEYLKVVQQEKERLGEAYEEMFIKHHNLEGWDAT